MDDPCDSKTLWAEVKAEQGPRWGENRRSLSECNGLLQRACYLLIKEVVSLQPTEEQGNRVFLEKAELLAEKTQETSAEWSRRMSDGIFELHGMIPPEIKSRCDGEVEKLIADAAKIDPVGRAKTLNATVTWSRELAPAEGRETGNARPLSKPTPTAQWWGEARRAAGRGL